MMVQQQMTARTDLQSSSSTPSLQRDMMPVTTEARDRQSIRDIFLRRRGRLIDLIGLICSNAMKIYKNT